MERPEKELLRRNIGYLLSVSQNTGMPKIRGQVLKPLPQDRTASATMEELRDWESCTG